MPDLMDALDGYEATEWPDSEWPETDFAEARGGRRAPTPQKYTPPPANRGYVTNATFQTAMDKVRADVAANRTATSNVGSQVDALSKRTQSEVKALRQQAMRDRDESRNTLQMLAILPLLNAGGSTKVLAPTGDPKDPTTTVTVATPPSTTSEILPLLLMGGLGGSSGSGSGSSGGMDSGMLLMVALLAANK